jgi:succinate dehydrogenase / fumarate reductase, flavoprotein subunit
VFRTALERTESRGAHYRTDYSETASDWRANLVVSTGTDGRSIRRRGVGEPSEPVQDALDEGYELDYHHLE